MQLWRCCDVPKFDDVGWKSGKNMQEYVNFLDFFTIVLQIFPVLLSRVRSTAGEGGTEKYWPSYQPST